MGIAECMPYFLGSYELVLTTPRTFPPFGSELTTTGSPLSSGFSLTSKKQKSYPCLHERWCVFWYWLHEDWAWASKQY